MASSFYPSFFKSLLKNEIGGSLESVTIKCLLLKNTHVFNASHSVVSDVVSHEPVNSGATIVGYYRKNIPLTIGDDATVDQEGATLAFSLTDNAVWPSATFAVTGGALYVHASDVDDSLNKLIYYIDFGGLETTTLDTFKILNPTVLPKIRRQ
jgi:hypothetical protein